MTAFQFDTFAIEGQSIAGVETNIRVPQLNLNLDIGRCPAAALRLDHLAVSHGHPDHLAGLPYYVVTRQFYGMKPPTIFLPHFLIDPIQRLLALWSEIQGFELQADLVGVEAGQRYPFRRDLLLEPLAVQHSIDAFGYVVYTRRQKLRPEFQGLPQSDIVALKRSGAELVYEQLTPILGFTGDTQIEGVLAHSAFLECEVLVIEATFLDERRDGPERARAGGHIHLDELVEHSARFANKALVLIHFSQAYAPEEIPGIVAAKCPSAFAERLRLLLRKRTRRQR
ncbi:MAG: MBL fold metallo-hydrolase [Myxococcales bacterium]|nr:MBL fold metallo-hydrolase [Myxococcales bacterium]